MDDKDLRAADIQLLANIDGIASFFAALGYNTEARLPQTSAALGITADSLKRQIKNIEQIAVQEDPADPLYVFVVELASVTVAATQGLARALRNRGGNYLLVLTDDYERLDFVLLERSLPVESGTAMTTRQVPIRPRVLTVRRRDPSQVQLRVLRRFTYTESDATAQYEKLQSAYTVAEWSKPFFNNLALFSDYYLTERLPDQDEWVERPEDAYHNLRQLMSGALERLSGKTVGVARSELIEPALEALGFGKASAIVQPEAGDADYLLYRDVNDDKPIVICLAYTWNRSLDGRDDTRDPESDENPGARVVSALDSGEAPWAIVTNGKLWRLYSAKTHSRATNYYEIDLEETLAMKDPNLSFRYFWLMFRSEAFVPKEMTIDGQAKDMSFLDQLLQGSEDYAKALGDRLKVRVFEDIFPHFAEGYIEHLKGKVGLAGVEQRVFQGTLTLLYRLLFLLYSESRGLLPVKEERGYWEQSITKLKEDIAEKAQNIKDEAPDKLRKAYRASSDATDLYDRLLKLFASVDRGDRDLNLPHYNGGLFNSQPEAGDKSQDAESARFLLENKIPDRYLALGLDLLARDVDDKRQDLVFIDYKSLGVRQLGSIYEGLLEFKIRLAPEKMAIVKGKRSEEVISYRDAQSSGKKVLTIGRGKNAKERVYQKGDVYLENDRSERKATGSYYTPDHIVKYIVENTVGPVLQEKFEKLRPAFRDAHLRHRAAVKHDEELRKQKIKSNEAIKVVGGELSRKLVDDLFDLRVLDPAMGSGHFLVEAVDYISDQFLGQKEGFLRPFIWNPVTEFLRQTRDEIVQEMEHQGVSIDASRLTDVNLLKRHVLKRCVYGVDLNPMAVELAKVSLWLDCFTIGAPLSFLDHHLKCGNSLIGSSVQDVEAELSKLKKGHVADLFGGPFQGLLTSTAMMLEIARTPDVTVEQSQKSSGLFASFEKGISPYKSALDIWVSRHFGNVRAEEYLTLAGPDLVDQIVSGGRGLSPEYREVISKATEIGNEKRFFHWDLEFPEAFVDLGRNRWKAKDEQGFDVVVGNPPYDVLASEELGYDVSDDLAYFKATPDYLPAVRGKTNLYKLFIRQGVTLVNSGGAFSYITPMALLGDDQSRGVRRLLLAQTGLMTVESFPQKDDPRRRVFSEAKLSTAVFATRGSYSGNRFQLRTHPGRLIEEGSPLLSVNSSGILDFDPENAAIPSCTQKDWELATDAFRTRSQRMGRKVAQFQGEVNETTNSGFLSESGDGPEVLRGASISLYSVREPSQGTILKLNVKGFLKGKGVNAKAWHHRLRRVGFQRSSPQNNFRRLIAAQVNVGEFCFDTVSYVTEESSSIDLELVLALLNSKFLDWYFRLGSTNSKINEYQFIQLPIPTISEHGNGLDWHPTLESKQWDDLANLLSSVCAEPGLMPYDVAEAISEMSRRIQEIEAHRVLKSRSERSRLAPESQPIQDAIDKVLFRCYGLSDEDARYIEKRLKEML